MSNKENINTYELSEDMAFVLIKNSLNEGLQVSAYKKENGFIEVSTIGEVA